MTWGLSLLFTSRKISSSGPLPLQQRYKFLTTDLILPWPFPVCVPNVSLKGLYPYNISYHPTRKFQGPLGLLVILNIGTSQVGAE